MINVQLDADTEMINDVVDLYLEKKYLTEDDVIKNGESNLTQTPIKMLESSVLEYRISQNNAYIYSCTSQDVTQIVKEFVRLKTWIRDMEDTKCKKELSQMLFPVFCHLYLDILCENNAEQSQAAMVFFRDHQSFFTCESLQDIIKDISNMYNKDEIETKPLIKALRSSKCELRLSALSAISLKNFISTCEEPMILLNVLNSWFIIEDEDNNVREDDDPSVWPESEMIMGTKIETVSSPEKSNCDSDIDNEENKNTDESSGLQMLLNTFQNLRDIIPQPMPLLLLQMHDSCKVSCSSVCYREKLLIAGSMNNDIKMLSFSEAKPILPQSKNFPIKIKVPNYSLMDHNSSRQNFSTLRGHCGSVSSVKLLRDPNIILSTSEDTTLRAWNCEDFSCIALYKGHNAPIWALDVSALNLYVATGSQDKTARLWMLDKTFPLRLYVGHYESVTCVKFHPNGVYLGTGSTDRTVRLFSVIDGRTARLFTGHTGPVHCLAFSPDGQYLASAGDCKEIIIWDLSVGQQFLQVDTQSCFVCDLSWSLDSTVLAITFLKRSIFLLHVQKQLKENENNIIGKYDLPDNRFISCQFTERNNLIGVSII